MPIKATPEDLKLRPGDIVMSDFDGTITLKDTGWVVFDTLELEEAWEWEYRWRDGEISSMECLQGQWDLVDVSAEELAALMDTVALDERFPEFVARARAAGAEVVVASDGLSLYLDAMLVRLGFEVLDEDPAPGVAREGITRYVNKATLTDDGVKIEFPHMNTTCTLCGNCKQSHLWRLRLAYERVIYIGDGYSDRCPAMNSDIVFAKNHLAEYLDEHEMPYQPFERFEDVIAATLD